MTAERFRSFRDLPRFPLGDGRELVYAPLRRASAALSAADVRLLAGCSAFAPLAEHAAQLCRQLRLDPGRQGDVGARLAELARSGFIVSEKECINACCVLAPDSEPPARVAAVGVPTRNRTASLEACLVSCLESGRRHGRACDYVVIDDSDAAETRGANRRMLAAVGARFGAPVYYAGPQDKVRFGAALAREAALPEETVRFGLVNDEGCPLGTGGSRNALLLHCVGEPLVQADDDTQARLAAVPGARAATAFTSRPDPTEFWFLGEGEDGPPGAGWVEDDPLAVHEQLLGRTPAACLGAAQGDPDLGEADAGFFRRLDGEGGRVLVTATGVVGDAGMGSPLHLLTLGGDSRARLLASEPCYRDAVAGRQVLRAAVRPTVSDGAFCMALHLGLDNRRLLPPFLPVQRNQDGVFGAVLRACAGGLLGFVPRAVFHRPPSPRDTSGDVWQDAERVRTGHLFQALIAAAAPRPDPAGVRRNLAALGRALADLAASSAAHFEETARLCLMQALSAWSVRLESLLGAYGGQPTYWADDARRAAAAVRDALADPDLAVPWDLQQAFGVGPARDLARRLVGRFGRLLQAWPAMMEAARALRHRGVRLAVPA